MTEQEIDEAFGATSEYGPLWQALMELLGKDIDSCIADASRPGLVDSIRQYENGRLAHAVEVRNTLEERMRTVKSRSPTIS